MDILKLQSITNWNENFIWDTNSNFQQALEGDEGKKSREGNIDLR